MEDTSREIRALQQKMWMDLPEEERFRRCGEMFALAKAMVVERTPNGLSPADRRKFIFRELYGFDLPDTEWLSIIYSGFWDYPFAFVTRYKDSTYLFVHGYFDDELDDYPSEYEVFVRNDIDFENIEKNFLIEESGTSIGRVDMKDIQFDWTHREKINSKIFKQIHND